MTFGGGLGNSPWGSSAFGGQAGRSNNPFAQNKPNFGQGAPLFGSGTTNAGGANAFSQLAQNNQNGGFLGGNAGGFTSMAQKSMNQQDSQNQGQQAPEAKKNPFGQNPFMTNNQNPFGGSGFGIKKPEEQPTQNKATPAAAPPMSSFTSNKSEEQKTQNKPAPAAAPPLSSFISNKSEEQKTQNNPFKYPNSNTSQTQGQTKGFGIQSFSQQQNNNSAATPHMKKTVNTYGLPKPFVIKFYEMMHRVNPSLGWDGIDNCLKELAPTLLTQ